jgi:hypothetical protein
MARGKAIGEPPFHGSFPARADTCSSDPTLRIFGHGGHGDEAWSGVGRAMDVYAKRTERDATHAFAVGDADTILARVAEYVDVGVSKFILRPIGGTKTPS